MLFQVVVIIIKTIQNYKGKPNLLKLFTTDGSPFMNTIEAENTLFHTYTFILLCTYTTYINYPRLVSLFLGTNIVEMYYKRGIFRSKNIIMNVLLGTLETNILRATTTAIFQEYCRCER